MQNLLNLLKLPTRKTDKHLKYIPIQTQKKQNLLNPLQKPTKHLTKKTNTLQQNKIQSYSNFHET